MSLLRNCGGAITLNPLHTYASAIPLTPKESRLYQNYYHMASDVVVTSSHPLWTTSRTLEGHRSFVRSVVFSPDGTKLASTSNDDTLRLWDVETGAAIGSALKGHTSDVNSVVFSPDGSKLASASYDNTVRLWDVETWAALDLQH